MFSLSGNFVCRHWEDNGNSDLEFNWILNAQEISFVTGTCLIGHKILLYWRIKQWNTNSVFEMLIINKIWDCMCNIGGCLGGKTPQNKVAKNVQECTVNLKKLLSHVISPFVEIGMMY